jgi:hypothetical protein
VIYFRAGVSFLSAPDGFFRSAVPWRLLHSHAPQNLVLPVELMHRLTVDRPLVVARYLRLAVVGHVLPAPLLGGQELALRRPGVSAAAVDAFVVDDRHDAGGVDRGR